MPNYEIAEYDNGSSSVIGSYSGPNGGLTTVRRTEKHLSILDNDIDFIDTYEEDTSKYAVFKEFWDFYIWWKKICVRLTHFCTKPIFI